MTAVNVRQRLRKPASVLRALGHRSAEVVPSRRVPLTEADELLAAEELDRALGKHLSRAERSKRAYELAEGAPVVLHHKPNVTA